MAEQTVIKRGGEVGSLSGILVVALMMPLGLVPPSYLAVWPAWFLVIIAGFTMGKLVGTAVPWIYLKVLHSNEGNRSETTRVVLALVVGVFVLVLGIILGMTPVPFIYGAVLACFASWLFLKKAIQDVQKTLD